MKGGSDNLQHQSLTCAGDETSTENKQMHHFEILCSSDTYLRHTVTHINEAQTEEPEKGAKQRE